MVIVVAGAVVEAPEHRVEHLSVELNDGIAVISQLFLLPEVAGDPGVVLGAAVGRGPGRPAADLVHSDLPDSVK